VSVNAAHRAERHPLAALWDPGTIRARCAAVLGAVDDGVSPHFRVERGALDAVADRVAALTRRRFPDLRVPMHSRWRHFESGGVDRKAELDTLLAGRPAAERARAMFDLTLVSVLLDAGAGAAWQYTEAAGPHGPEARYTRSEGLGVASFRAFVAGSFSATPDDPLRVDATALARLDTATLRAVFQVSTGNPLVGLDGRAGLLQRLGAALRDEAARDGRPADEARPALFFDRVTGGGSAAQASIAALLAELLRALAPIWTSGSRVQGLPAGDVWPHPWAGAATPHGPDATTSGWVPFHKLTQWLSYSLAEPLRWAGLELTGLDTLTGLPEYRNGGLLLDGGVIVPRQPQRLGQTFKPGDDLVVEWRALTVALLDELAARVRERLAPEGAGLPLACILEGGTWAAGREIAAERRPGGAPPLRIDSDGTVF
jgi:hypothetical protein